MSDATKAVFLSYAREDSAAAQRLAEALRTHGVEVWFDQNELRGGDAWDSKIRQQINDCALFLPIVSRHTQGRSKGYFRLEWKLAVEQTHLMAEGVPFLAPIAIDDTPETGAVVPPEFMRVQWTRLPGALPTPQFIEQIQRLLNTSASPGVTAPPMAMRPAPVTPAGAPPAKSSFPTGIVAMLAAVVLALVGYIALRPTAKTPPTGSVPAKPVAETKSAPPPAAPAADDKSIAVLPFENMSDDKENTAFFADGMHEDILTNLANIRELRVVSRTSVMEYRGTKKKIPQIARELGVTYILEGSVRRAGTAVRITGQLIRAATDEHLWAKSYDRELTPKEMFALQAALATEIAAALQTAISPETKKLLETRPTDNLAAYELYLKARALPRPGETSQKKREALLQSAVELDRNYAQAWAELAITHGYIYRDQDHTPSRLAKADAAAARAVQLAPDAPATFLASGYLAYLGHRDWPQAIAEFEKILRLQPANAEAIYAVATVQKRQGRWSESLANHRRAEKLDPASVGIASDVARLLWAARRWDEAIAAQQRVATLRPGETIELRLLADLAFRATGSTKAFDDWLAGLPAAQQESQAAISFRKRRAFVRNDYAEWRRLDRLQPESDPSERIARSAAAEAISAAMFIAAHGDLPGARDRLGNYPAEIRAKLELDPDNYVLRGEAALIGILLGEHAEALRSAKQAVELVPESIDANTGPRNSRILATVYAWTGDKDRALAELNRLARVPYGIDSVHSLRVDPTFAPLRGDPRFEALLKDPKNNAPLF